MNIVNVGYHSTNYYSLDINSGKLLIDCGWPGTFPQFAAEIKRKGIMPAEIRHLLVTHFHLDHAGLVQEFKDLGAELIVLESQIGFIKPLNDMLKAKNGLYLEINEDNNHALKFAESRQFLASLGIAGEILTTPGHSDDSITLILDDGIAFTGDLTPRFMIHEEDQVTKESWDKIYQHRITRIYPGHGN
jgi:glyoxylase-like metal-dependent hydrolase (beta-lactamase superfamily II)